MDNCGFQAVLIDLPGHGRSGLYDDNEPSIGFMASKVRELIDHLEFDNYHVVGHSMGGYVALELKALDYKCQRVVLLNSNFWEDPDEKKKDRIRVADIALKAKDLFISEAIPGLFYRHERPDKEVSELIQEARKMEGIGIAYASLAMRCRQNHMELLIENPEDFLIIQGLYDPLISPERMNSALENIPVKKVCLENSGHMAHIEEPDEVLKAITDFIK